MDHPSPLEAIFFTALEKGSPQERAAYLDEACAGDPDLRRRVEKMLAAQGQAGSFLEQPAPDPIVTVNELPNLEQPGAMIGPYKLIEPIGEGGMGAVWMAQQTEPVKRLVAVKLIKAGMDSKQVIARFEAERQALALMDHPNIARVFDGGSTCGAGFQPATGGNAGRMPAPQGRPYFVMELVKGVAITKYCDEHHLTPRQRLELFMPVCQAIQHAHQKGIIHRDLKPSNVLVALYDGKPVPKVIDFGVAKATGHQLTDKTLVTGFGNIVGTLEYMSPEQAEINQLDIDTRSDIYSLGVLLYELLAGSPPFTRKELEKAGMLEMLRVIREQEPSKPSTKLSTAEGLPTLAANRGTEPAKLTRLVRGELDWIVMKALEKDRNRRYETANGFAMDVQRYLADEAVLACPPSLGYRFRKFARRNRGTLATVAVVSLALLLGTVISISQAIRARQAELDATKQRNAAEAQRRFARQAVDKMFTQVAEKWLSRNTSLEPVQKQILLDALQIYEELAKEEGADPALRLERGNAYRRIGEIYFKLGNPGESEKAFKKAQEILGSLVDQHASEPDYRSALGSAYHQYGFALHYSARIEDAMGAYRQALLHRERLVADHPHVPRYARELAVSLGAVANMLESLGSRPESDAAYLRAVHLMETLPKEVADEPDCRFELGLLYSEYSGIQRELGRGQESRSMFSRGKAIYEQLVSEFPHDPTYQEELAWALRQEGLGLLERPEDAEKAIRRALAINEQLARKSPTVPGYRDGVGGCNLALGQFMLRTGRRAEAEDAFRLAAGVAEQQLKNFPDQASSDYSGLYGSSHSVLQTLLLEDGRRKDAEAVYLRAVEMNVPLSRNWMKSPYGRWNLADYRWGLANLASRYGRFDEAARYSNEAISLYEQVAAEQPDNKNYQQALVARKGVSTHARMTNLIERARLAAAQKRPQEAEDLYRQAVKVSNSLTNDFKVWEAYYWAWRQAPYELSNMLQAAGRPNEALKVRQEALSHLEQLLSRVQLPKDRWAQASLLYNSGLFLSESNEPRQAAEALQRAAAACEMLKAEFPTQHVYTEYAGHSYRQLGSLYPGLGKSAEAEKSWRAAIQQYEALAKKQPDNTSHPWYGAHSYWDLAEFLAARSRMDEAEDCYRKAAELFERLTGEICANPHVRNMIGRNTQGLVALLKKNARLDEAAKVQERAVAYFEKLAGAKPAEAGFKLTLAESYRNLAAIVADTKRKDDAEKFHRKAVEISAILPADFLIDVNHRWQVNENFRALAELLRTQGRAKEAEKVNRDVIAFYQKLAAANPKVAEFREQLGQFYSGAGEWDKAIAEYTQVIERDPARWESWYWRGHAYWSQQVLDKALTDFSKAIELNPQRANPWLLGDAWHHRSAIYGRMGQFDKAATGYTTAIELAPGNVWHWLRRAQAYAERKQWPKTVADCTRTIELNADFAEAWQTRGDAYAALGQWEKAAADYSKLLKLSPNDYNAFHLRAVAHVKLNRPELAVADLRQAFSKGYKNLEGVKKDDAFAPLRNREDFKKLLAELDAKKK